MGGGGGEWLSAALAAAILWPKRGTAGVGDCGVGGACQSLRKASAPLGSLREAPPSTGDRCRPWLPSESFGSARVPPRGPAPRGRPLPSSAPFGKLRLRSGPCGRPRSLLESCGSAGVRVAPRLSQRSRHLTVPACHPPFPPITLHNWERLGTARLGSARHGSARLGTARHGSARLGSARHGSARLGSARLGSARLGTARLGTARLGTARLGSARHGSARLGSARLGTARLGTARLGTARLGSVRCPDVGTAAGGKGGAWRGAGHGSLLPSCGQTSVLQVLEMGGAELPCFRTAVDCHPDRAEDFGFSAWIHLASKQEWTDEHLAVLQHTVYSVSATPVKE
ncbi:uncharacterized protein LOC136019229 [Lathamus discolor]|uniref:uncharacterized protein LOC136019229 n=1 Tax=Lathamus discolor TaxID=678569 RepID=UPI0032B7648E